MHKLSTNLVGVLLALAVAVPAAATSKERTPDGSFLRYRANTVAELKNQISSDTVVQARYAAHFGLASGQMLDTIEGGVKLVTLKTPTKVDMYYVSRNSKITHKTKLLPKGTQVFATSDGTPFLAWSCGNPLRAQAPPPPVVTADSETVVDVKVAPSPPEVVTSLAIAAPPSLLTEVSPAVAIAEPALGIPVLGEAVEPLLPSISPVAISSGGALYNLGWLAGLAALTSERTSTPEVPEPGSVLAIAMGISGLAAYSRGSLMRRRK